MFGAVRGPLTREVVATLLDEEVYLWNARVSCSGLRGAGSGRAQRTHPEYEARVDRTSVTRLLGPTCSIYSRYVDGGGPGELGPGRPVDPAELPEAWRPAGPDPALAGSSNDEPMHRLRRDPLLSRPQVSDDNPFSEAQFKTLKYHPSFPGRFGDQGQAKTFCRSFFRWYNAEHRHGGISMLTPEQVHFGNADQVIAGRKSVLREAWAAHPERFVRGVPKPKPLPEAVFINPPIPSLTTQDIAL